MFRALFIKEWLELRALRWVGLGLGLALPVILFGGAQAGKSGWMPMAKITGYDADTLLLEVMPMLLLAFWGLLALLIAGQVFAGERASGTESFLLQRPIRRRVTWTAKFLAAASAIIALLLAHAGIWFALSQIVLDPVPERWASALEIVGFGGSTVAAVCFLAGVAAGSVVASPMQAVLLGIVLSVVPVALSQVLLGIFPLAAYADVRVGEVLPWLLPIGFAVGGYFATVRGEPAGRGRWPRMLWIQAISVALLIGLFVVVAPAAMRLDAGRFVNGGGLSASPGASSAFVNDHRTHSGWIVDIDRGRRIRYLAPPTAGGVWSPDGSRVAVMAASGFAGRFVAEGRADIYDADGRFIRSISAGASVFFLGKVVWTGAYLIARHFDPVGGSGLTIAHAETGETRRVTIDNRGRDWVLLGPTERGQVYVLHRDVTRPGNTNVLQRFDPATGELEPTPLLEEEGFGGDDSNPVFLMGYSLSPSGRYLQRGRTGWIIDLQTGEDFHIPAMRGGRWLSGDRIVARLEDAAGAHLALIVPGESPRILRSWRDGSVLPVISPDRRNVLVKKVSVDFKTVEAWVYEPDTDGWSDLGALLVAERTELSWAGPETIAFIGPGFLGLSDFRDPSDPRFVIGRPDDG